MLFLVCWPFWVSFEKARGTASFHKASAVGGCIPDGRRKAAAACATAFAGRGGVGEPASGAGYRAFCRTWALNGPHVFFVPKGDQTQAPLEKYRKVEPPKEWSRGSVWLELVARAQFLSPPLFFFFFFFFLVVIPDPPLTDTGKHWAEPGWGWHLHVSGAVGCRASGYASEMGALAAEGPPELGQRGRDRQQTSVPAGPKISKRPFFPGSGLALGKPDQEAIEHFEEIAALRTAMKSAETGAFTRSRAAAASNGLSQDPASNGLSQESPPAPAALDMGSFVSRGAALQRQGHSFGSKVAARKYGPAACFNQTRKPKKGSQKAHTHIHIIWGNPSKMAATRGHIYIYIFTLAGGVFHHLPTWDRR